MLAATELNPDNHSQPWDRHLRQVESGYVRNSGVPPQYRLSPSS